MEKIVNKAGNRLYVAANVTIEAGRPVLVDATYHWKKANRSDWTTMTRREFAFQLAQVEGPDTIAALLRGGLVDELARMERRLAALDESREHVAARIALFRAAQ